MNSITHIEQSFSAKLRDMQASDAVFYGLLVFIAHLSLTFANRYLTHQSIAARIPSDLSEGLTVEFALTVTVGLLIEVMIFLIGWLFIAAMAVLLDGESNARTLFGWLGLCFLPAAAVSLFGVIRLWIGVENADYAAISDARTMEDLSVAIRNCLSSGGYRTLQIAADAAYLFLSASAIEITHRVCGLIRWKALLIVGSYAGLLFALNRFAGQ